MEADKKVEIPMLPFPSLLKTVDDTRSYTNLNHIILKGVSINILSSETPTKINEKCFKNKSQI